jgi:glycosyltransferase involved in cell wall biosynthesis
MITVLMATCNGEKYVAEQIDSILNQTETRWKLIIQDDYSKDKTALIVNKYAEKYPDKIFLMESQIASGSAKANFFSMMKYSSSEYMMTCDQDDVWLPGKIEITLKKMQDMESKFGSKKPLLVHTDLKVVDENLNITSDSLFSFQNLDSKRDSLNNILVQNNVTGCTMMVNRALLELINEIPEQAIMHDWWLVLNAAAFGETGFVEEPTVLYRQHTANEIGAKNADSLCYNIMRLINREQSKSIIADSYLQAESFLRIYESKLAKPELEIIQQYVSLPKYCKIKRLKLICKYDFWKNSFFRKCGQILFM